MSLFLRPPEPEDLIARLVRLGSIPLDVLRCPFDDTELEIHLHGGADCPTCGHEFEVGHHGRLLPSDSTIETEAQGWPDTLPWGEKEQDYYRTAKEITLKSD